MRRKGLTLCAVGLRGRCPPFLVTVLGLLVFSLGEGVLTYINETCFIFEGFSTQREHLIRV